MWVEEEKVAMVGRSADMKPRLSPGAGVVSAQGDWMDLLALGPPQGQSVIRPAAPSRVSREGVEAKFAV